MTEEDRDASAEPNACNGVAAQSELCGGAAETEPAGGDAEVTVVGDGGGGGAAGRVKGPWSPEEDAVLSRLVAQFGARNWSMIARGVPGRSGKSCRLRWCNQLDPCVKRKPFTGNLHRYCVLDSMLLELGSSLVNIADKQCFCLDCIVFGTWKLLREVYRYFYKQMIAKVKSSECDKSDGKE